ncbi:MAG: cytochrome c biogenesis protein ResB [Verrucomicrobiota bacterium]
MNGFAKSALSVFTSLKLTIVLLIASMALVFFGTLDQTSLGIHEVQKRYFESFVVVYPQLPPQPGQAFDWLWSWFRIPLPGGYLVGGLLLINLLCAHFVRFKLTWKKSGIMLIHVGLIVLLLSQLYTQLVQRESMMTIQEGGVTQYSEAYRANELVLIDRSDAATDRVFSVSAERLRDGRPIDDPALPVVVESLAYFPNSGIFTRRSGAPANENLATEGIGADRGLPTDLFVSLRPVTYQHDEINTVSAYVRFLDKTTGESLGTFLVSNVIDDRFPAQTIEVGGTTYEIDLRFKRYYHDFALALEDFRFDRYPGTNIPHNYSSDVIIVDPAESVERKALIFMNHPLRYGGLTFYQASFDRETEAATVLQVVRNPGWTLPYIAVLLIGAGMCIQFGMHFFKFLKKRFA